MFDFLHNIFRKDIGGPDILLFGPFHFLYLFLILGLTFLLCYLNFKKSHDEKKKILDIPKEK